MLVSSPLAAREPVVFTGQSVQQEQVDFADLDLRHASARLTLNQRVMKAAWAVCIAAEGKTSARLALGDSDGNCPNSTYDAARPQISAAVRRAGRGERLSATSLTITAMASAR